MIKKAKKKTKRKSVFVPKTEMMEQLQNGCHLIHEEPNQFFLLNPITQEKKPILPSAFWQLLTKNQLREVAYEYELVTPNPTEPQFRGKKET